MNRLLAKIPALLLTLIVGLIASSSAFATATIVILNNDAAGVGFNDPTAAAPVGGNTGTTVGEQRLKAFEEAARIWGATLTSGPTIVIRAQWSTTMTCGITTAALGSAGNTGSIWRDFPDSVPNFWYGNALANALRNSDLNGASPEINATFNARIGDSDCLPSSHWYYGLDNNHGSSGIDLVAVLLHEFGHGLGFQTFTSSSTGALNGGFPTIYDKFLLDKTQGKTWADPTMTDAMRVASAINTGNLVWNGPQVTGDAPGVLSSTPRLRVNTPAGISGNYVVGTATFGPALSSPGVTGDVAQAIPTEGCSAIGGAVSGKIALIDRGTCNFVEKVKNAQNAGAIGVIVANSATGVFGGMSGTDPSITIPSVMISFSDGNTIKGQLGGTVNVTLLADPSSLAGADSLARPLMYTPSTLATGSSVSHWDTTLLPNQLMEPSIGSDLSHSVTTPQDLTFSLFRDIGWCSGCPQPPPPSPTPTPSPPPNDNFASAQSISGCSGSVTGTNVGATKEGGEPVHVAASPGSTKSVWYQWQAPATANVTIDTISVLPQLDTLLAVYTGTTVSGLTLVPGASNDDIGSGNTASRVTFDATQGTVYRIAVDGFNNNGDGGDTGSITLNWTESNCTPPPNLLLEENTNRAAAVDSVTLVRGPFPIIGLHNFSGDQHTRVIIFTSDLGLSQPSAALSVKASGTTLTVENVGTVTSVAGLSASYIVVRLPDGLPTGDLSLVVALNGVNSNTALIGISP